MKLQTVFKNFFSQGRISNRSIISRINDSVKTNLLLDDEDSPISQAKLMLQGYISSKSDQYGSHLENLIAGIQELSPLEINDSDDTRQTVLPIDSDTLLGLLEQNICKTFVMPIYQEITSIHKLPFWKVIQKVQILSKQEQLQEKKEVANPLAFSSMIMSGLTSVTSGQSSKVVSNLKTPEPSEYIRRIGDHFISFIQQLDSFFDEEMQYIAENQDDDVVHVLAD